MKNSFIYIMLLFFLSNSSLVYANDKPMDNGTGQVILDLDDDVDEEKLSFVEEIERIARVGKYFNETYEDQYLYEEDLTIDLKKFYPSFDEEKLYERQKDVRSVLSLYRKGKYYYDLIKEKMIVPEEPPLIFDDDEYETGYKEEYIEAPEDTAVVVQDFKKVISYSSDPRDIKALDAKFFRDLEKKPNKTKIEKLFQMGSKLDWKKFFTFDAEYSPFTGEDGVGEWVQKDNVFVRVISEQSAIDGKNKLKMGLNFYVEPKYFILGSTLSNNRYIKLDFSKSENFENVSLFYPALSKLKIDEKNVFGYGKSFLLPFIYEVKNPEENTVVSVDIKLTLCDFSMNCHEIELSPKLSLERGEGMASIVANYIVASYANLPSTSDKNFQIVSVSVDEPASAEEGEVLRIVFENHYAMSKFDLLIEDDDFTEFLPQRVSIDGKNIVARFEAKNKDTKLLNKEFTITANIDEEHYIRQKKKAVESSVFDILNSKLSVQLILLAVLGGFILNFMPCVFPVVSMKIMAVMEFGSRTPQKIRRSFFATSLGIWLTFAVLIALLCLLKHLGYSLGWGIQFQSPLFIVLMMFVLSLFIFYILGIYKISTPHWLERLIMPKAEKGQLLQFATGVLVVVLATPCTGPYLATTIGFAFAGSYIDMALILSAVGFGLSIPYVLLSIFPYFMLNLLPKPGKWMEDLNKIMLFLLFLTIVWLLSVYASQTSFAAMMRMVAYLFLCLIGFYFRYVFMKTIEEEDGDMQEKVRLKKIFGRIFATILIFVFAVSLYDAQTSFMKHSQKRAEEYVTQIDFEKIGAYVQEGKVVIVAIEADWCLTCRYNDLMVFSNVGIKDFIKENDIVLINVDWTNYNEEILSFMEEYGRKGLPFYIVYSKRVPDGMVLPEILSEREFSRILTNIR